MPSVGVCAVDSVGGDVDGQAVDVYRHRAVPQPGRDHRISGERFDHARGRQIGRQVVIVAGTPEQRVADAAADGERFAAGVNKALFGYGDCRRETHRIAVLSIQM